jgi:hypothetical protein
MGKTRRKLYGRSRRRQRGGVCLSKVGIAVLAALATFDGAHADDVGLTGRITKWWGSSNLRDSAASSIDLADYILSKKWVPSDYFPSYNSVDTSCGVAPNGMDAEEILEPYIESGLVPGQEYTVEVTGDVGKKNHDIQTGTTVTFKGTYEDIDFDSEEEDPPMIKYYILARDNGEFFVPIESVTLKPIAKGGRASRKQRRKTLRRKK